jgi:hypothetical protein
MREEDTMRLDQATTPTFAHHQTFHPRFGWLKKGFTAAEHDPGIFLSDDATVRLGVGKNMVAAIRFWTTAFRVLERVPAPDNQRVWHSHPTPLGKALLDEQTGYDPYFEDPATLWVLHWHLVSAESDVPVWWSTFNDFTSLEFSEAQLTNFVTDEVLATSWDAPNTNSISKDVDCLLHMYAPRTARARQGIDELLDSPFRELGLIVAAPGSQGRYRFNRGLKPGLSPEVLVYACLDYLARNEPDARTATLTHLTNDPGTPGRLLKLTEDVMHRAFLSIAERFEQLSVSSPAGAPQLAFDGDPGELAGALLHAHYARRQPSVPCAADAAGPVARGAAGRGREPKAKRFANAALEAQDRVDRDKKRNAAKPTRDGKAGAR